MGYARPVCTCTRTNLDASFGTTVREYIHFVHVKYPPAETTNSDQPQQSACSTQVIVHQQTEGEPLARQNLAYKLHQLQLLVASVITWLL